MLLVFLFSPTYYITKDEVAEADCQHFRLPLWNCEGSEIPSKEGQDALRDKALLS